MDAQTIIGLIRPTLKGMIAEEVAASSISEDAIENLSGIEFQLERIADVASYVVVQQAINGLPEGPEKNGLIEIGQALSERIVMSVPGDEGDD